MSSLVGFLSLVFAIGINFYLFLSRYIFKFKKQKFNLFIRFSSLLTLLSFFSLMYAYVVSDFSNNIFIRELKLSSILIIPTEKIITGTLNIITMTLPSRKFR